MLRDQATLSKEVHDVLVARWEGFKRLARTLPNRQILAVELVRTRDDETAAVLTIVQNGEPVRYLIEVSWFQRGETQPATLSAELQLAGASA